MYTYFDDLQRVVLAAWHWRPFRSRKKAVAAPPPAPHAPAKPAVSPRPRLEEVGSRS